MARAQFAIERREDGEYRLVGTERDGTVGAGYYSDGNGGVRPKHEIDEAKGEVDGMLVDG